VNGRGGDGWRGHSRPATRRYGNGLLESLKAHGCTPIQRSSPDHRALRRGKDDGTHRAGGVRANDRGGHRVSWADVIRNVKVLMTMIQCQILLYAVVFTTSKRSISIDDLRPVEGERALG
jgi:hypothetical protein